MTESRKRLSRCPICSRPAEPAFRPFCSKRCADVDLGRWLTGRYVVPGEDGEAADEIAAGGPGRGEEDSD